MCLAVAGAGMTTALTATVLALDVLLVESEEVVVAQPPARPARIPNSRHSLPGIDSFENALLYLRAVRRSRS